MAKATKRQTLSVEVIKEKILNFLSKCQEKGAPKSKLPLAKNPSFEKALEELVSKDSILSIYRRYYLKDFAPTLEKTKEKLLSFFERWVKKNRGRKVYQPISELILKKKFNLVAKTSLFTSLDELAEEGHLIRLKVKKVSYYLPLSLLAQEEPKEGSFDPQKIREAYKELVGNGGFLDVSLSKLRRRAGINRKEFQDWILEQSRQGKAHLSAGDYTLISKEEEKEAILLGSKKFYMVRLRDVP
ncbi:hypothetical protein [Methylacidiphilum caldifontis]|uniref:Uncharacterized protein n=1 Tax=Methylacidiphilum caldifontis TaxID=2795386 RepID=A0A4Y8PBR4_9BACT|nr:hypothetical protein [Methylacidiphilum caldifontis]TFE67126.1 hypothetical protein A7Q10_09910 [Methylacidiphilum caldifontis]